MKRCSISLIREMQINSAMGSLLGWIIIKNQQKIMTVSQNMDKLASLYTGGNVKWGSHYGKQNGDFSKNKKQNYHEVKVKLSHVQLFATPWTNSPWNSPGQNTAVGSLSLLQGILPIQGSNPGLPHCRQILYQLSHKGSPWNPAILLLGIYPQNLKSGS